VRSPAASPDAGKYVPDELATVKGKLADLKSAFDKKDYVAVLAGAPSLLSEAQNLLATRRSSKDAVIKGDGRRMDEPCRHRPAAGRCRQQARHDAGQAQAPARRR